MSTTQNPDVVVVGAGPVGLVAAHELARRGIRVRILEKLSQPTDESRAIAVHARSLEMLDRMGVADDLVATGMKSTGMTMVAKGKKLIRVPLDDVDSAFPYTLVTAQTETERVLTDHLGALVTIDRGHEVTALSQDDHDVQVTVRRPDGSTELIVAPWVLGTDGGHSVVRRLVGTKLQGSFKGERFILGDVEANHDLGNTNMYTFFSPDGPVVVLPMRDGRVRFLAQIHDTPGTPLNLRPRQEELQRILDERVGAVTITKSHWLSCFEIHHGQVPAYRHGRVLLAGDAAHIHSPAGGQGMNTGMQDAFNLGWKIAMTIRGEGGQALLDSYHAERHPIGKTVLEFTGLLTKVGTLKGGPRLLRDALMRVVSDIPPAARKMAGTIEETNIAYKASPLSLTTSIRGAKVVAGAHVPHLNDAGLQKDLGGFWGATNSWHTVLTVTAGKPAPAVGPRGPVQALVTSDNAAVGGYDAVIADPAGVVAERYGLPGGGRVVVRPDGYIGAVTELEDQTGVSNYFSQLSR